MSRINCCFQLNRLAGARLHDEFIDNAATAHDDYLILSWLQQFWGVIGRKLPQGAADQGNPIAQNSLGTLYQEGRGAPKDLEQAFRWYKKSAGQKFAPGVFNTAISYYVAHSNLTCEAL